MSIDKIQSRKNMNSLTFRIANILASLVLASCASTKLVMMEDIASDKEGHLISNFAAREVAPVVLTEMTRELTQNEKFRRMNFKIRMDYEGKAPSTGLDFFTTVTNLGRGLRQELWDASSNGLPHGTEFRLSYFGLIPAKFQIGYYNNTNSFLPRHLKKITFQKPGISKPQENTEYEYETSQGMPNQIVNLITTTHRCASDTHYPASMIHPKLAGQAIDLNCESSTGTVARSKNGYAFLVEYGFALHKSFVSSEGKSEYRVVSLELN